VDALDASAGRVVQLARAGWARAVERARAVREWNVRMLIGHLVATRQAYCALLEGASAADLIPFVRPFRGTRRTTARRCHSTGTAH
jgi:hypothetical protein